jgi:hypothetical protein
MNTRCALIQVCLLAAMVPALPGMVRAQFKRNICFFAVCIAVALSTISAHAFSLLGPYESWMEQTNGFRQPGDSGGPMDIGSGYRWNVPVVTYGFDKSFLDYFGTNGVAAVESAIQILNNLPPASQIAPTNYPLNSQANNYAAAAQNLLDLKSATLTLLLEQMGLTEPTRNIFAIKQWDSILVGSSSFWPDGAIPNDVVLRNFDPESVAPSQYVNGIFFTGWGLNGSPNYGGLYPNMIAPEPSDPYGVNPSVSDCGFNLGETISLINSGLFFTGLTEDDVGGLSYLLSTNNIAYETLLPGISGVCTNSPMNGAWRPGVDKISFVPQPFDSLLGQFLTMTNQFTDTYITNGVVTFQQLQRVTTQPDILFCAGDVNYGVSVIPIPYLDRTGTTNWLNNASLNGNPTNGGPGVIQPGIKITFNKLNSAIYYNSTDESTVASSSFVWGTFDGSTNDPIVYPAPQIGTCQFTIRMWLLMGNQLSFQKNFDWNLTNTAGLVALLQTSTNLADWVTLFSATNDSSVYTFENHQPSATARFYRVIPH